MKLFKVLFYLGRFWDWYDLVNGIIDEKYSIPNLSVRQHHAQCSEQHPDRH